MALRKVGPLVCGIEGDDNEAKTNQAYRTKPPAEVGEREQENIGKY